LENILFTWYQQARASNIPVDGAILWGKVKIIAAHLNIENFTPSKGWIARFRDRHGLVYKKLAGESAAVDSKSTETWLERLPSLLEGYEQRDIYNADQTGLFYNVLPDRILALKGVSCHGGKTLKTDLLFYFMLTVLEVTNKCRFLSENLRNRDVSRM
jgi:hypothetical protein